MTKPTYTNLSNTTLLTDLLTDLNKAKIGPAEALSKAYTAGIHAGHTNPESKPGIFSRIKAATPDIKKTVKAARHTLASVIEP